MRQAGITFALPSMLGLKISSQTCSYVTSKYWLGNGLTCLGGSPSHVKAPAARQKIDETVFEEWMIIMLTVIVLNINTITLYNLKGEVLGK